MGREPHGCAYPRAGPMPTAKVHMRAAMHALQLWDRISSVASPMHASQASAAGRVYMRRTGRTCSCLGQDTCET
jgi:hypothetical protein